MSSLSRDDVAKLAGLARIEMSDEELVNLSNEFTVILDAVAECRKLPELMSNQHPTHYHFEMFSVPML
jgi:aspartyl-tRNA(Asn)/glutamyl-tRNA(Gln) amidotransferase subunit C